MNLLTLALSLLNLMLTFLINPLTLLGGLNLKSGNKLLQLLPPTLWAFCLPSIVLLDA